MFDHHIASWARDGRTCSRVWSRVQRDAETLPSSRECFVTPLRLSIHHPIRSRGVTVNGNPPTMIYPTVCGYTKGYRTRARSKTPRRRQLSLYLSSPRLCACAHASFRTTTFNTCTYRRYIETAHAPRLFIDRVSELLKRHTLCIQALKGTRARN